MNNNGLTHAHFLDPPPDGSAPAAVSSSGINNDKFHLLIEEPITDLGNAEVVAMLHRNRMAFVPEWGWVVFNGRYWEGGDYKALEYVGDVIKRRLAAFTDCVAACIDRDYKRLEACCNKRRLTSILGLAEAKMHVPVAKFDSNPYLLNAANGVIDLRTGELLPHSPNQFLTKLTPVYYERDAVSSRWNDTVSGIACGDAELVDFFQRLGGYAVTGDVSLQHFFYFYGEGANGKSLMTDLWAEVLGGFEDTGYAVRIPNESILGRVERTAGAPSPDLLALKGKRLALLSEQSGDRPLNTERIKDLTGGDSITARAPHRGPITFRPTHTLVCCGNHVPYVNASDHGFWRRFLVVPFKGRFTPSRLGEELRSPENLSAILTWLVRGAILLRTGGWKIPLSVSSSSDDCRREAEPLQGWLEECCERCEEGVWTTVLFENFNAWRAQKQEDRMSHSRFTRRLKQMGYDTRKSNGKTLIQGLRIRCSD